MKNETMGINPMSKSDLKELLKETKETIATDVKNQRSFSVVDLWNVQKRQRTSISMRRSLSLS